MDFNAIKELSTLTHSNATIFSEKTSTPLRGPFAIVPKENTLIGTCFHPAINNAEIYSKSELSNYVLNKISYMETSHTIYLNGSLESHNIFNDILIRFLKGYIKELLIISGYSTILLQGSEAIALSLPYKIAISLLTLADKNTAKNTIVQNFVYAGNEVLHLEALNAGFLATPDIGRENFCIPPLSGIEPKLRNIRKRAKILQCDEFEDIIDEPNTNEISPERPTLQLEQNIQETPQREFCLIRDMKLMTFSGIKKILLLISKLKEFNYIQSSCQIVADNSFPLSISTNLNISKSWKDNIWYYKFSGLLCPIQWRRVSYLVINDIVSSSSCNFFTISAKTCIPNIVKKVKKKLSNENITYNEVSQAKTEKLKTRKIKALDNIDNDKKGINNSTIIFNKTNTSDIFNGNSHLNSSKKIKHKSSRSSSKDIDNISNKSISHSKLDTKKVKQKILSPANITTENIETTKRKAVRKNSINKKRACKNEKYKSELLETKPQNTEYSDSSVIDKQTDLNKSIITKKTIKSNNCPVSKICSSPTKISLKRPSKTLKSVNKSTNQQIKRAKTLLAKKIDPIESLTFAMSSNHIKYNDFLSITHNDKELLPLLSAGKVESNILSSQIKKKEISMKCDTIFDRLIASVSGANNLARKYQLNNVDPKDIELTYEMSISNSEVIEENLDFIYSNLKYPTTCWDACNRLLEMHFNFVEQITPVTGFTKSLLCTKSNSTNAVISALVLA